METQQFEKNYTLKSLIGYTTPTIAVMVFISIYTMVDGMFVARYVNATALSAINIFMPFYSVIFAIALMLGTGGSAIIAKKMGEKNDKEARSNFTFLVVCGFLFGVLIMIIGQVFLKQILGLLGANETAQLFDYTITYARIILAFSPFLILQVMFENFFVTAGKPKLNLLITLIGGGLNIGLDYVFIAVMGMGIKGAAIATAIGIIVPALIGVVYFLFSKNSVLHFVKPLIEKKVLLHACINGSSEMMTNLSSSVVTIAFNLMMLHYIGVDGVAAVTIMLYVMMFLTPIFMGYSIGIAPIISYKYGSKQTTQLQFIVKRSYLFIGISSLAVLVMAYVFGPLFIKAMIGGDTVVYSIAIEGFPIFSFAFLFMGLNIFTSMLFTALSNGKISAIVSFLRILVFELGGLIVLPLVFGVTGIWMALPIAEFLSVLVCFYFVVRKRHMYGYL